MNSKICLIGLGYVGLPLAVAFSEKFKIVGFDISQSRISELNNGHDKTLEIDDDLLNSISTQVSLRYCFRGIDGNLVLIILFGVLIVRF
jgi:UDP-N-acetyl-D-mannosaminuronate dehydrogenase